MSNAKRKPLGYYIFWTAVTIGSFWYCGAMFVQALAS